MISKSRDAIAHSPDTKLLREYGEDTIIDWGNKFSPEAKPFRKNPRDTPTCGWGNRPNPREDPIGTEIQGRHHNQLRKEGKIISILMLPNTKPTYGPSRKSTKEEPRIRQHRRWGDPINVYTHPTGGRGQTDGYKYSARGLQFEG